MQKFKRLMAVLIALMVIVSSMSAVLLGNFVSAEEAVTVTEITESPREFLKAQAIAWDEAYAEANSLTSPTKATITVAQKAGPWFVDVTNTLRGNIWQKAEKICYSASRIQYFNNWSSNASSLRIEKPGTADEKFQVYPRANQSKLGADSGYNASFKLRYVAEVTGEYYLTDNFGGFTVNSSSNGTGYSAYVTVYVNGIQKYKSSALSKAGDFAVFDGVYAQLSKGETLEIAVVYDYSDTFSGDILIDLDPHLTLIEEHEDGDQIKGLGYAVDYLYDELSAVANGNSVAITQSTPWKAQYRTSATANWNILPNYYKSSTFSSNGTIWQYIYSAYNQTPYIGVGNWAGMANSGTLGVVAESDAQHANHKNRQVAVAYTAEKAGEYTVRMNGGTVYVRGIANVNTNVYFALTINNDEVWRKLVAWPADTENGVAASTKGYFDVPEFTTVDLAEGDVVRLVAYYELIGDMASADAKSVVTIDFDPYLYHTTVFEIPEYERYSAGDKFREMYSEIRPADASVTAEGKYTQEGYGWSFKYGKNISSIKLLTNYQYSTGVWGTNRLLTEHNHKEIGIHMNVGSSMAHRNDLLIAYRGCSYGDGGDPHWYFVYDYAYSFTAPRDGEYTLLGDTISLVDYNTGTRVEGAIPRVYLNGEEVISLDMISPENPSVRLPQQSFTLKCGDEVVILLEKQYDTSVRDYNDTLWINYDPVITYGYKAAAVGDAKYDTLAQAVEAANAGETVKLIADAKGEGLVINKDITIDFDGFVYEITTPVGSTGTVSNGLQLLKGNNVTLKNGTLKVADTAKSDFYILVQNYTNLTVTDMVLDGTNLDKYSLTDGDSYTLSNNCGNVVVDGKTDIIANDEGDLAFAFDVCKSAYYDAPVVTVNTTGEIKGNIEVTAEIAENLNIEAGIFNTDVSAYIADGAGLKLIDGVYTIADAALIADIDASGKVDAADLSYIRQSLLEKISDGKVYDINGDGDIDIRDLVRIKKLAGNI